MTRRLAPGRASASRHAGEKDQLQRSLPRHPLGRNWIADPGGALERLAVLPADLPSYVAVSALLTRALAEHGDGPRAALHIALEHVLAAAAPEGVVRPFADPDPLLREVLADHRAWGTRHEAFLVACVAPAVH